MKVFKKVSSGVPFVRKASYEYNGEKFEADIKNGDEVVIMDSGNVESGQFGEQHNFRVQTRNGEKKLAFNQRTINVLIDSFGDATEKWVNEKVRVILKKDVIAGKKVEIVYLVTEGWSLDEYGELVKEGAMNEEEPMPDLPF